MSGALDGYIASLFGGLDGHTRFIATLGAELMIGLRVDVLYYHVGRKTARGHVVGHKLSAKERRARRADREHVLRVIRELRREQVGSEAGATVQRARGLFQAGRPENVVVAVILAAPSERAAGVATFKRNVVWIAEEIALAFAQAEVIIRVRAGARDLTSTATPKGARTGGELWRQIEREGRI